LLSPRSGLRRTHGTGAGSRMEAVVRQSLPMILIRVVVGLIFLL
jgi:hypothetical protein